MPDLLSERRSYVDGRFVDGDRTFAVENPADESLVAEIGATPPAEVENAIGAARRSFDEGLWRNRPREDRAASVRAMLDHIEAQGDALVGTLVAEAGQPTRFAQGTQIGSGLQYARDAVDLYLTLPDDEPNPFPAGALAAAGLAASTRAYEPIGVVSAITPYNAALMMGLQKVVPALLTGCSVILRPSPLTPLSSVVFATAAEAAGLPAGVLSVVVEEGADAATLMTTHPAVDMVSFTGSTAVGKQILAQAASTVKLVALELGGKSAQIYLPEAVGKAAFGAMAVVAMTSGQACVAATRMLVPHESKDEVLAAVSAMYGQLTVGPPTAPTTLLGPVISAAQRERCERYVAMAEEAGAKVVTGGARPAHLDKGYYFEPTVLDVPDNGNPAARDEIFGPVLSVIGYADVDDAVRIANDSPYGLSGQVYGETVAATAVARRLRTGAVNVNAGMFSAYAPSGGYKQSGLGRERGVEGIRAFQEVKHLAIAEFSG